VHAQSWFYDLSKNAFVLKPVRLPPSAESRLLRFACGLPAGVQRVLAGAPARIDGLELAPDIQMLRRLVHLSGDRAVIEGLSPLQARAKYELGNEILAAPKAPMAKVEEGQLPGPAGSLGVRLYVPPGAVAPGPLIVYFHGGGWTIGSVEGYDGTARFLAAGAAATVLSVDYRLAPEHPFPAAFDDALAAFRWAAAEAAELGADPARIAVAGDSAGGNLAAAVALYSRADEVRPAMQALLYPVTDAVGDQASRELFAEGFFLTRGDMDVFERHYLPADADRADPRVSVLRAEDLAGLPPAYVVTCGFDPLRDEGEAYAARMRAAGVRVALRRHPALTHGFANASPVCRSARRAMDEVAGAIRMGLA